jgi:flagellar biosynthesis protein FlhA
MTEPSGNLSNSREEQQKNGLFWIPDALTIELGIQLVAWAEAQILQDWIKRIRQDIGFEYGIHLPPVRMRDAMDLSPNAYRLLLHGCEVAQGRVMLNHLLAIDEQGDKLPIDGVEVLDPVDGNIAYWIESSNQQRTMEAGYLVVDAVDIIVTHITKIVKSHLHHFLGLQETRNLLKALRKTHPAVVESVALTCLGLVDIQNIFCGLLRDHVSIRDLPVVLTTIADYGRDTRDMETLIRYVKQALRYE